MFAVNRPVHILFTIFTRRLLRYIITIYILEKKTKLDAGTV